MTFVIGLGATQVVEALLTPLGNAAAIIVLPISLVIAGIYGTLGYCASQRMRWAFITGIVLYSIDTLIFLAAKDFLGLAFHGYALFCIYSGLRAEKELGSLESTPTS